MRKNELSIDVTLCKIVFKIEKLKYHILQKTSVSVQLARYISLNPSLIPVGNFKVSDPWSISANSNTKCFCWFNKNSFKTLNWKRNTVEEMHLTYLLAWKRKII
jgi:hypothetical protein